MLFKILLPLLVLAGVYGFGRLRATKAPRRAAVAAQPAPWPWPLRLSLAAAMLALVGGSGWFWYGSYSRDNQILDVRVINTRNGTVNRYQAQRKRIHARTLETLDGRRITLADIERMEVFDAPTD